MLLTTVSTVDAILGAHAAELGGDFRAYRNHVYRVVNFCALLSPREPDALEKTAVASAFHDLGIWTARTFDYLDPSIALAGAYLARSGRAAWTAEVTAMIREHHRISRYHANPDWLVEAFRRADWIDVSRGVRAFGLSRALLAPIFSAWPDAGFHARLLRLSLTRLRTHPLAPLPMMRW